MTHTLELPRQKYEDTLELAPCDGEPFLVRDTGDGVSIQLHWDVADRVRIDVIVADGKLRLDTFEVPVAEGHAAFRHTAMYSEPYAESLR